MPTLEYKSGIGQGEDAWGKPIAFPEATKFSDIFEEWRWWEHQKTEKYPEIPVRNVAHYTMHDGSEKKFVSNYYVGDYCSTHRSDLEHSLHVLPNHEVLEYIDRNMIIPERDSCDFELIVRTDGILICAKPNQIIASRWLALLDPECLGEIQDKATYKYRVQ
jgi:hypothetical protein